MKPSALDLSTVRQLVFDSVLCEGFRRATFGGPVRGMPSPWMRVVVRPVAIRGERQLQIAGFESKKCVTKNYASDEAAGPLGEVVAIGFASIHIATTAEEIDIRVSKRGKVHVGRRPAAVTGSDTAASHNRVKDVPLPEGRADRVLEVMGILTATGRVKPTMRAKFTQINEFLKQLRHVLDDAGLRGLDRPVEILDCGCGSSYLTIAAHHDLNDVLGIPARITGVDVNDDLIRKSLARAEQVGGRGLSFACGRIGSIDAKPDIVLALHACNTATDDAIAAAVHGEAKLLLSVPCCHKHLNRAIRPEGDAAVLRPVLRHGILHERTADIVTDAFRALALRIIGYRSDVVEFVSPEHTARNLMIRAVRGAPVGEAAFVNEYRAMKSFWGATPYIEQALGEGFKELVR